MMHVECERTSPMTMYSACRVKKRASSGTKFANPLEQLIYCILLVVKTRHGMDILSSTHFVMPGYRILTSNFCMIIASGTIEKQIQISIHIVRLLTRREYSLYSPWIWQVYAGLKVFVVTALTKNKRICQDIHENKLTGPDAAQNLRGAKLIFQDLYVYIFAALKKIIAYTSAFCL